MRYISIFILMASLLIVLSACQTSDLSSTVEQEDPIENVFAGNIPTRIAPINVQTKFIAPQGLEPQAIGVAEGNLYDNGGFENGLSGWTGCAIGAITSSNDALEGSGALQINPANCFYRSVTASPDQELNLTCNVKILSGTAWTGMGLNFTDANFNILTSTPTSVATSNSYTALSTTGTAPAGTQSASMWLYSDNPAVVDNCSLTLGSTPPPPPPPPPGDNLLENGEFSGANGSQPASWSVGCTGSASLLNDVLNVSNGTCVDQILDAGEVSVLQGSDYSLLCAVSNTSGYAALTIFFDNDPVSVAIPAGSFGGIELTGTAPASFGSASVSIYGEGTLAVNDCSLIGGNAPPPPPGDNFIDNGGFTGANGSQPASWSVGCAGSASLLNNELSVSGGTCVDQALDVAEVIALQGSDYTLQCSATNASGYAALTIFFDGNPVSETIPAGNFGTFALTGTAPASFSSASVSIYSEGALVIDNCSFTTDGEQPSGSVSIDVRNNIEGPDTFVNNGPFTFDIAVRNSGDVPFTNVRLESDNDELDCDTTFSSLAVGEIKSISCTSNRILSAFPLIESFSHIITATATTADGRIVTDSDQAGYRASNRANGQVLTSIVADNRVISAGGNVTFFVTVAHAGNVGGISQVQSNVADCRRQFSPAISPSNITSYQCVATNVQGSFTATVSVENDGPYPGNGEDNVEIVVN